MAIVRNVSTNFIIYNALFQFQVKFPLIKFIAYVHVPPFVHPIPKGLACIIRLQLDDGHFTASQISSGLHELWSRGSRLWACSEAPLVMLLYIKSNMFPISSRVSTAIG